MYKQQSNGDFVTIKKIKGITEFVDATGKVDQDLKYGIKAKAKDGRESKMVEVRAR